MISAAIGARERIGKLLIGDTLAIVFQPVVDIRTGKIVGAEALARFNAEPRRPPDQWFGEAWDVGLGLELELEAIERALTRLPDLPSETYVAVNAAPTTMCSQGLVDLLQRFPADRVVLELTEHSRVDDYDAVIGSVTRLRALGARLSVDDAGAGFASFQHVLFLRPDLIKIDRSLTTHVDENPVRAALAGALVTFAASLGARVCAEGIETAAELAALQRLGIEYGQGYLLARPAALPLPAMPPGIWTSRTTPQADAFMRSPAVRAADRLEALETLEVMDTPEEEDFNRFTRLVARLLNVPVALISLVDDHRQFFKSAVGLTEPWSTARETPLTHSFCQHAVTTKLPLIIDNAAAHPLVQDNPATTQLGVAAYAGAPIMTADQAIGALCAVDSRPRQWTTEEVATLQDLAGMLAAQIELRRVRRVMRDQELLFRKIFDQTSAAVVLCDMDGRVKYASIRFCELIGRSEREIEGKPVLTLQHADDVLASLSARSLLLTGQANRVERQPLRLLCADGSVQSVHASASVIRDSKGKARFMIITVETQGTR